MIVLAATLKPKLGQEVLLETTLKQLFPLVKLEQGTVDYTLHRSTDGSGKYLFYEKYKDQQSLDFHMSTPYLQELFGKLDSLLSEKPELCFYEDIASIHET